MHLITGATGHRGLAGRAGASWSAAKTCASSCATSRRPSACSARRSTSTSATSRTPARCDAALAGADQLFLSCADDPRRVEWETRAIDDATAAGVQRIVKLSSIVAEPGAIGRLVGLARPGRAAPAGRGRSVRRDPLELLHVEPARGGRRRGADRTFVRTGRPGADRDDRSPRCRRRRRGGDGCPRHDGRTYVVTGPEAITYDRVAAELTVATAAEVQFVDVPDEAALHGMVEAGLPDVVAQQIVNIFASARAGVAEQVTPTVASLTGRAPQGIACFAHAHAAAFAPAAGRARASGMTDLLAANKALIRHVFEEVIPAGDAAAMRDLVAANFLDHDPLPGQPDGAAGAEYVVRTMHGAHPDLRFTIDDLVAEADRVTIRWTLRGTNTGPMLGRPPSGERRRAGGDRHLPGRRRQARRALGGVETASA